ncbi:MAG TPA: phage terminase large subunit family protein, partial [Candidatus Binataceae bacterium]
MASASFELVPGFPWPPLFQELREIFRLRPKLPLAEWAEANITLSPEYSNSTGPLMLFGWQRDIFNAITDPTIETVVIMSSTQVVKSLAIMCAIGYWIVEEPGPILLVEPKKDSARDFSKRRLMPLARDCPALRDRISSSVHDGSNTIQSKDFPGGNLLIVSARTPVDLAQHTIRYLVCDETDKYDDDVGGSIERQGEGDPIDLAWERAMTYGSRRKRVLACSPTVAGQSRIGKALALSDQRRPYVPCPHCGAMQVLRFRDRNGYHVKWDSGLARDRQPATARYYCVKCDKPWTEQQRWT